MEKIGYKNRTRFRRDYIKPLVEKGLLNMTIPDKPTSKNQKYIATKQEIIYYNRNFSKILKNKGFYKISKIV